MKNGSARGPRGDGPVAAGAQSWRRGQKRAAARPGCTPGADEEWERGDRRGGAGERRADAAGRPGGRGGAGTGRPGAHRSRRPRDTHQTRGTGARGGRRRRRRDVRAARERPRSAGDPEGARPPSRDGRGQQEEAQLPEGTAARRGQGSPVPLRLWRGGRGGRDCACAARRRRSPPSRQQDCACAPAPRPHLPLQGCAQPGRLGETRGEPCGAGTEVFGLG